MNVLVFNQALTQGHVVTAFVRDPAKLDFTHANLRVMQGDVTDYASVERAVRRQEAVLCALGAPSPLRRHPTLVDGVRNIIRAMSQAGARRFIYLSWLGVRDGRDQLGFLGKRVIAPLLLRHPTADHEAKEKLIKQSGLEWTIVRPPKLTNGRRTGAYRAGERIAAKSVLPAISRADLADFMLRQVADDTYLRKTPAVMY